MGKISNILVSVNFEKNVYKAMLLGRKTTMAPQDKLKGEIAGVFISIKLKCSYRPTYVKLSSVKIGIYQGVIKTD